MRKAQNLIYELSIWGKHGVRNAAKMNNGPSVEKYASRTAKTSIICIEKLVKESRSFSLRWRLKTLVNAAPNSCRFVTDSTPLTHVPCILIAKKCRSRWSESYDYSSFDFCLLWWWKTVLTSKFNSQSKLVSINVNGPRNNNNLCYCLRRFR